MNDHPIKKIFVLMLENRSFDHMLGCNIFPGFRPDGSQARIDGLLTNTGGSRGFYNRMNSGQSFDPTAIAAVNPMQSDPPHEFCDVLMQLCGIGAVRPLNGSYPPINNSGFVDSYSGIPSYSNTFNCCRKKLFFQTDCKNPNDRSTSPQDIMGCFRAADIPALYTLATEYAVCDRWFSSMPGPTWPNRYFAHAASSAGLDDSPDKLAMATDYAVGQEFQNGTLFNRLNEKELPWEIFAGDHLPQSFALKGMTHEWLMNRRLTPFVGKNGKQIFREKLQNPDYEPIYIFIEPNWGKLLGKQAFTGGNSQHPADGIAGGDKLIRDVYSAIRNSPHWEHSMLIITYDEHGGFYDHCIPSSARPPGDITMPASNNKHGFDFTVYGARVPAIIVSPWIKRNIIDDTLYDHSSIPATVMRLFGLRDPLTNRDRNANDLLALIGNTLRTNAPLDIPYASQSSEEPQNNSISKTQPADQSDRNPVIEDLAGKPIKPATRGFLNIAHRKHHAIVGHRTDGDRFLKNLHQSYGNPELFATLLSDDAKKIKSEIVKKFREIIDEKGALEYISEVNRLCEEHRNHHPHFYGEESV
ncbi:MAG: phosphoesterase [Betaproteobacteria bacterium]|nr:phosphoesterase [Betaproteobacteria bacterium]